jgi:hypothetical protein
MARGKKKAKRLPLTTRQGVLLLFVLTIFFIVVFTFVFRWIP